MDLALERALARIAGQQKRAEAQIKVLRQELATVKQQQQADAQHQQASVVLTSLVIGSAEATITWPQPWADTNYRVDIELILPTASIGNLHATLKTGSKTTVDCVITLVAALAIATVRVEVQGTRIP